VTLVVAFAGLGLAIGFSLENLNLSGIALAALSAIAIVFVIVGNARAMKQASGIVVVFYMMGSAGVTQSILFLIFGTYTPPITALGWIGFAGVAFASTAANLAFFGAVPILGAVRATMITNIEPLLAIVFCGADPR
jgi:drug/metabolite transporter (DMT)-like permease